MLAAASMAPRQTGFQHSQSSLKLPMPGASDVFLLQLRFTRSPTQSPEVAVFPDRTIDVMNTIAACAVFDVAFGGSVLVVFEILIGGTGLRPVQITAQAGRLCHHSSNCTSTGGSVRVAPTGMMGRN